MKRQRSVSDRSSTVLVLLALAGASNARQTDDYLYLDNVEGEVGFNPVPRRPMALSADGLELYAVNTLNSTVCHFANGGSAPDDVFQVPKSPVSIGVWDDPDDTEHPEKLVVVCDGTYCLVILDRTTGETLALVELRDPVTGRIMGEPGDLLIDPGPTEKRAFVSCAAADAVLEIDLENAMPFRRFDLPAKDPVFMCFDRDMNVLVAPMLSGNNSGARQTGPDPNDPRWPFNVQHFGATVLDFTDTAFVVSGRLPDEDLFRCVRGSGTVQALTTGMGTILFAIGIPPGIPSGNPEVVWQLTTEANNKDRNRQGEAAIRGDIVQNQLSVATLPSSGGPNPPSQVLDLDVITEIGQPYSLTFAQTVAGTFGVVCGLLTDNVIVINASGTAMTGEYALPEGSIPRGVLYSPLSNHLFVYCWGTSKVRMHSFVAGLPLVLEFDLGRDQTPADIQEGRRIFYDASHSEKNNASCASCHVEGRTDMLVWNLSKGPTDDKGPMVTQTLAGIEKLGPFHWRGEQKGLIDFNPAFVNLLGAPDPDGTGPLDGQLSASDFAKFEKFVFSIQNRPNPFQNQGRVLDAGIEPPQIITPADTSAIEGQARFVGNNPVTDDAHCERCHNLPLGTGGAINTAGSVFNEQQPHRIFLKIPPFHDLYKKEQDAVKSAAAPLLVDTVSITLKSDPPNTGPDEAFEYPLLGAGFSHAGLIVNFHEFVLSSVFGVSLTTRRDIAAFAYQWDQGVAPATYRGILLEDRPGPEFGALLDQVELLGLQALARNCDLVVYGTTVVGGVPTPMRWYYLRNSNRFLSEAFTLETPTFFEDQADDFSGKYVFLGLPVGSGARFAIDYDGDDLLNAEEIAHGTDPFDADSDDDTWPDGHEVDNAGDPLNPAVGSNDTLPPNIIRNVTQMVTARAARINVETNEPCRVTIEYTRQAAGAPLQTKSTSELARTHSILLTDLLPSTGELLDGAVVVAGPHWNSYDGTVKVFDPANNMDSEEIQDMPLFNRNLPGVPTSFPITTRTHVDDSAGALDHSVIGSLAWSAGSGGVTPAAIRTANVRVDHVHLGPPVVNQPGVRVIARLFVDGVRNTTFIEKGTSDRVEDGQLQVDLDGPAGSDPAYVFTGIPGPYLVSEPTSAGGQTTLTYKIPNLPPGSHKIQLNIELIVRQYTDPPYDTTFTVEEINWYDKSTTPAANRALVYSVQSF